MPWGQPQQRHPMKRIPKGHFTVFNQAGAHYEAKKDNLDRNHFDG